MMILKSLWHPLTNKLLLLCDIRTRWEKLINYICFSWQLILLRSCHARETMLDISWTFPRSGLTDMFVECLQVSSLYCKVFWAEASLGSVTWCHLTVSQCERTGNVTIISSVWVNKPSQSLSPIIFSTYQHNHVTFCPEFYIKINKYEGGRRQ